MIFGMTGTLAATTAIAALGVATSLRTWFKTKATHAAGMVGYYLAFGLAAAGVLTARPWIQGIGVLLMIPNVALSAYFHHREATGDTSPVFWPGLILMGSIGFMNFACLVAGVYFGASAMVGPINLQGLLGAFFCFLMTFTLSRRLRDPDFRERTLRPHDAAAHLAEAQAIKDSIAHK